MKNRKRDTDVQNRLLDSVGEGKGGMFQENSIETYILSRVKQITSPGWMHETSSGLVHWEDPERSGGEGSGRGDRDGEHMQIHGRSMSMYDKNHYNTVKLIKINGKKNLPEQVLGVNKLII